MEEVWKEIDGYDGRYLVSNYGRVVRVENGGNVEVAINVNSCGYWQLHLKDEKKRRTVTIHRLVATHFIPNPKSLPQINHKDGDKKNNRADNLEWCTASYNTKHAFDNGLKENTRKAAARTAPKRHPAFVAGHVRSSSKRIEVTKISTGEKFVYSSANEAARQLGLTQGNLSAAARGAIKSTMGYTAKYL